MQIEYPAKIVKHGNGFYVKIGKETRDILGVDLNDYVKVAVQPIGRSARVEEEGGATRICMVEPELALA